ncbi:MAG: phenylalanine--tRNA ligase subunit alpha [Clostridia bacterium]|nr:phenylalanine--tRNA ligase subunit alpha [Clostridia bacterium]
MQQRLDAMREAALAAVAASGTPAELQEANQRFLGKKGELTTVLKELGGLPPEERKSVGKRANEIKETINEAISVRREEILNNASVVDGEVDLTLPGLVPGTGALHPVTQMCHDLNDAFRSLGFEIYSEDEITSEKYAFDNMNFPPDHPARESMDTYWIRGTEDASGAERLCLRPHLTGGSVRHLMRHGAPARFVYPGHVYRNETTDARHERAFYQYEALIVEKDFSFASGKLLVSTILDRVFGREVEVRMRAGFFPFVEPGFEIDMRCLVCGGVGCKVCKNVGWIEVMPGGTPHPNVLRAAGLDPAVWTGFYINIGLDRLVMMRTGVDDVRLFHSADLRFLTQFR